jgi:hypothetical protein
MLLLKRGATLQYLSLLLQPFAGEAITAKNCDI